MGFETAMKVVKVTGGRIAGVVENDVHVFRGIPFAATTAGRNLWRPPQPVEPWSGIRDASKAGKACHQPHHGKLLIMGLRLSRARRAFVRSISPLGTTEGDDCLNLNVWTPAADPGAKLPVAVWIHGGSFTSGSGASPIYDGARLAAQGMVVVTINYRLNIWGFMGGDDLFPGDVGVANRGYLDQLRALEWVNENIRAFGGDPDCVTVMGESAGATSTIAMAMSPKTNGLMRRAICLSGAAISIFPHDEYSRFARDYFQEVLKVKPGDADALLSLSVDQVRKAAPPPAQFLGKYRDRYGSLGRDHFTVFGMATGTDLFPCSLHDYFRAGGKSRLDLMIGTCKDEGRAWTLTIPGPEKIISRAMFEYHSGILNPRENPEAAYNNYKALMPGVSEVEVRERAMTDALFRKWSVDFAGLHSLNGHGNTFLYRFDWNSPAVGGALRCVHCMDLPGVFQNYKEWPEMIGSEEEARPAGDALNEAVVSFIKTGRPKGRSFPDWSPYDSSSKACMTFDTKSSLRHDIDKDFEKIW